METEDAAQQPQTDWRDAPRLPLGNANRSTANVKIFASPLLGCNFGRRIADAGVSTPLCVTHDLGSSYFYPLVNNPLVRRISEVVPLEEIVIFHPPSHNEPVHSTEIALADAPMDHVAWRQYEQKKEGDHDGYCWENR